MLYFYERFTISYDSNHDNINFTTAVSNGQGFVEIRHSSLSASHPQPPTVTLPVSLVSALLDRVAKFNQTPVNPIWKMCKGGHMSFRYWAGTKDMKTHKSAPQFIQSEEGFSRSLGKSEENLQTNMSTVFNQTIMNSEYGPDMF